MGTPGPMPLKDEAELGCASSPGNAGSGLRLQGLDTWSQDSPEGPVCSYQRSREGPRCLPRRFFGDLTGLGWVRDGVGVPAREETRSRCTGLHPAQVRGLGEEVSALPFPRSAQT